MTAAQIEAECQRLHARGSKPILPEVRPLVEAFYNLDGNGAGGDLHIVLDDGNDDRRSIEWCVANAKTGAARWLGQVLLLMSRTQLRKL